MSNSQLEQQVADNYRKEGYKVQVNPESDELPFDLGNYRPDLVVQKDNERFIIEVRGSAAQTSVDRLRDVAELVTQHPGWRFLLITGDDTTEAEPLTNEQINQRKTQAERLISLGEMEAAFLTLWSVLEALLRRLAEQASIPIERFPTTSLIKHLYSQGELSMSQYEKALDLQLLRNSLAHGLQTPELGDAPNQLLELVNELESLLREASVSSQ